jgi:hypothetical protein
MSARDLQDWPAPAFASVARLAFDWRARAAGMPAREPGEDDA